MSVVYGKTSFYHDVTRILFLASNDRCRPKICFCVGNTIPYDNGLVPVLRKY